ncbi:MAG: M23 family metallopeptidase [Phormidesmis sp.]
MADSFPISDVSSRRSDQRPNQSLKRIFASAAMMAGLFAPLIATLYSPPSAAASPDCPAALDRIQRYTVASGDTLASVAATHQLQPATLLSFNRTAANGAIAPGTTLLIPPFNGVAVSVSADESWQSLAERYGNRPEVLFEVNGCVSEVPGRIFVPGANLIALSSSRQSTPQLSGYPLSQPADIVLSYGWQPHSTRDELVFNNGIAFAVDRMTDVISVDSGTVAFVGEREGSGQIVVINHAQGIQTRYANISDVSVSVGQSVGANAVIGKIGGDAPAYLYFEVRTSSDAGWVAQDPGRYLPALELR